MVIEGEEEEAVPNETGQYVSRVMGPSPAGQEERKIELDPAEALKTIAKGRHSVEFPIERKGLLEFAQEKFNGFFRKEQKPGEPTVSFDILFTGHETEKDASRLPDHLKICDIYIPESFGWDQNLLSDLRELSAGIKSPKDLSGKYRGSGFQKAQIEALHSQHKEVIMIDIPSYHPLIMQDMLDDHETFLINDFDDILRQARENARNFARLHNEREEYMLSQLKKDIEKSLQDNPELAEQARKKGSLNVFMSLGAAHTRLFHALRRDGQDITSEFDQLPQVYSYENEMRRRFQFGKEVDDTLVARTVLEGLIRTHFGDQLTQISESDQKQNLLMRKIIPQFSFDEIKQVVLATAQDGDFKNLFTETLHTKNLALPKNEEELDQMIAEHFLSRSSHASNNPENELVKTA